MLRCRRRSVASDPSRPDGHGGGEVAADHGGVAMWRGGRGRDGRHEAEVRAERERRLLEMTPGSSLVFHPGVHESLQALEKGEVRSRLKGHRDRLKNRCTIGLDVGSLVYKNECSNIPRVGSVASPNRMNFGQVETPIV